MILARAKSSDLNTIKKLNCWYVVCLSKELTSRDVNTLPFLVFGSALVRLV